MSHNSPPPPNPDDCTIDELFGSGHPYNYCIKETDNVVDKYGSRSGCENFGLNCIETNIKGLGKYMGALFSDPKIILDTDCDKKLGNKYVLKTGTKCYDPVINKQVDRYTYINNMDNSKNLGTPILPQDSGILPSSLSKASRINGRGLFSAIINEDELECKKVKLKCHVLNKYKELYTGESNYVNIDVNEIENISEEDKVSVINNKKDSDFINTYQRKQGFSNFSNFNNSNKDMLNDTYYILLALILLFVIFKIIHKK